MEWRPWPKRSTRRSRALRITDECRSLDRGGEKDDGRGDRIRTCDPLLPKQMRYQAALLPDFIAAAGKARFPFRSGPGSPGAAGAATVGGPGGIRTPNLAVMSGRLYR